MEKLYRCSKCKRQLPRGKFHEASGTSRKREVTSRCRDCRSETYFSKRYPDPCTKCGEHKKLNANGACRICNEGAGLKECKKCYELLPAHLSFYQDKGKVCKTCRAKRRTKLRAKRR